jgi:hypothetical protein
MDLGSLFLVLALAILVGLFIARPLFRGSSGKPSPVEGPVESSEMKRSRLLADRDRLLTALQDLDFDNGLGKVPAENYPSQRAELRQMAADVLRQLDELQGQVDQAAAEDRVEQAVAARRADAATISRAQSGGDGAVAVRASGLAGEMPVLAGQAPTLEKDDLEELIASRRKQRPERSSGFCPQCGKPVLKSDHFCSRCGAVLI